MDTDRDVLIVLRGSRATIRGAAGFHVFEGGIRDAESWLAGSPEAAEAAAAGARLWLWTDEQPEDLFEHELPEELF